MYADAYWEIIDGTYNHFSSVRNKTCDHCDHRSFLVVCPIFVGMCIAIYLGNIVVEKRDCILYNQVMVIYGKKVRFS